MNDENTAVGGEVTAAAAAAPAAKTLANIVRGTMPVALVAVIRFNYKEGKEGDVAKTFGTTSGKVADIRKNRNFAYVTEDFVPTQEQKDAAVEWMKQVPDYDKVGADAVITLIEKNPAATAEQAAAFLAKRTASRPKTVKTPSAATTTTGAAAAAPAAKTESKGGKGAKAPAAPASASDVANLLG